MNNTNELKDLMNLFDVLVASTLYIAIKDRPHNPFVKKLGETEEENQSLQELKNAVFACSYMWPQIEELYNLVEPQITDSKQLNLYDLETSIDEQQVTKDTQED